MLRKIFFLFILISISNISFCQDINFKDISNYSCFIEAKNNTNKILYTASGFIVNYNNKDYLITAYHVATGQDPITGESLLGESPSRVTLWYQSKAQNKRLYKTFSLLNRDGTPYYYVLGKEKPFIDIAVMHLNIFDSNSDLYTISKEQLDTSTRAWPNKTLIICGFPQLYTGQWIPKTYLTKTFEPPIKPNEPQSDVFFDTNAPGLSGAPVYITDLHHQKIKLLAVDSQIPMGISNPKIIGAAPYINMAIKFLEFISKH